MRARVPFLVLVAAFSAPCANGQALFTGETGGNGASSLFVAANASFVRNFTTPANFWTAYTRGVHDRLDAFAFYGTLAIFGRTQQYAGLGSNFGILKRARHGVDVAFLSFFSTPFNHRDQAATVFATFAPIASQPVRLRAYEVTLYGGYLRTEPSFAFVDSPSDSNSSIRNAGDAGSRFFLIPSRASLDLSQGYGGAARAARWGNLDICTRTA